MRKGRREGEKERWEREKGRVRKGRRLGEEGESFRSKTSRDLQLVVEQSPSVSPALFRCVLMMPRVAHPRREDSNAGPDGFRPSQVDNPPVQHS